jgi:hypothetical protein
VFSGIVLLFDDILEMLTLCKIIKEKGPKERWYVVMYVFYEILILTNSIMFLYFFKHMAMFKMKKSGTMKKKKKVQSKKNDNRGGAVDMKRPSDMESSESVFRVKRILEKGTSSYTRGPKSIDVAPVITSVKSNFKYSMKSEVEYRNVAGYYDEDEVVRRVPTEEGNNDNDGRPLNTNTFNTSLNGHNSSVMVTHT